ncbi:hypothetical protein SDC9_166682 [bioreactor metagenome]|uniref:Uncharacterized protein n=1 Tax=bioreactor metagenome TaxID=1076179 RepID=A0A645G595_9ZZZZ
MVGDEDRNASLFTDTKSFLDGIHYVVRLVAHMGRINTVIFSNNLAQFNQFFRVSVAAGGIDQAAAHTKGTVFHTVSQHGLHHFQFFRSCPPVLITHHSYAQTAVSDKDFHVGSHIGMIDALAISFKGCKFGEFIRISRGTDREYAL